MDQVRSDGCDRHLASHLDVKTIRYQCFVNQLGSRNAATGSTLSAAESQSYFSNFSSVSSTPDSLCLWTLVSASCLAIPTPGTNQVSWRMSTLPNGA